MSTTNIKEEMHRLIEKLPDDATWEDVMHEIYMRAKLEDRLTAQAHNPNEGISWDELKEKLREQA